MTAPGRSLPNRAHLDPKCGADLLVRGRPPGRLYRRSEEADEDVGRGPGGPPHESPLVCIPLAGTRGSEAREARLKRRLMPGWKP